MRHGLGIIKSEYIKLPKWVDKGHKEIRLMSRVWERKQNNGFQ